MQAMVETLFRCATAPDAWEEALDLFCKETGSIACVLIQFDDIARQTLDVKYSGHFRRPENRYIINLMEQGADQTDHDNYRLLFDLPPGHFVSEQEANQRILGRDRPHSPFLDELEKIGISERVAAPLNSTGPWIDFLAAQIDSQDTLARLKKPDMQLVTACFRGAVSTARILSSLRARFSAALTALDRLGLGVALVLADGSVVSVNSEATRIVELQDGIFKDPRGILRFSDADLDRALHAALASCHVTGKNKLLSVPKRSGEFAYLASIQPIEDSAGELEKGLRCAFLLLVDPTGPTRLESKGLAALGGLSSSEAHVLDHLLQGKSVAEISRLRDTSIATTRTHLRAILAKLRCRHQQDLIRLAAETKLPLID